MELITLRFQGTHGYMQVDGDSSNRTAGKFIWFYFILFSVKVVGCHAC